MKKENDGRTRIFCFGIGTDVNTHLLDRITEDTRAVSQYVLPDEDLEVKVSSFFSKIKEPVLANPTLRFSGGIRATKLYPSPLPDLFKGEQLVLVGRYSGKGDAAVTVEGAVNGTARKFTYEVSFPEEASRNEFIPRLWATRRVGYLLDEIRLHGENAELRDEVTELARKYSIVTPYTAYLILEDETHRNVPMADALAPIIRRRPQCAHRKRRRPGVISKTSVAARQAWRVPAMAWPSRQRMRRRPAAASGALESRQALGLAKMPAFPATASPAEQSRERLVQYSQQGQFVAGKSFFQNGQQWTDSAVQKQTNAKRVRIQFGSAEYFDLIAKQPKALPWLALGQNVQFVLNDTVYDIYE